MYTILKSLEHNYYDIESYLILKQIPTPLLEKICNSFKTLEIWIRFIYKFYLFIVFKPTYRIYDYCHYYDMYENIDQYFLLFRLLIVDVQHHLFQKYHHKV